MSAFVPYANEEESLSIAELTVENRLDRVSLYGSIDLTRDQAGLENARQLQDLLKSVIVSLEATKGLPAHVVTKPTEKVGNPFK